MSSKVFQIKYSKFDSKFNFWSHNEHESKDQKTHSYTFVSFTWAITIIHYRPLTPNCTVSKDVHKRQYETLYLCLQQEFQEGFFENPNNDSSTVQDFFRNTTPLAFASCTGC